MKQLKQLIILFLITANMFGQQSNWNGKHAKSDYTIMGDGINVPNGVVPFTGDGDYNLALSISKTNVEDHLMVTDFSSPSTWLIISAAVVLFLFLIFYFKMKAYQFLMWIIPIGLAVGIYRLIGTEEINEILSGSFSSLVILFAPLIAVAFFMFTTSYKHVRVLWFNL